MISSEGDQWGRYNLPRYINRTELVQRTLLWLVVEPLGKPPEKRMLIKGDHHPVSMIENKCFNVFPTIKQNMCLERLNLQKRMRSFLRTQKPKIRNCNGKMWADTYVHMKWWPQRNMLIHLCRNFATCHCLRCVKPVQPLHQSHQFR